MDRRSVIVAGVLAGVLAAALGVGIALSSGGGGQSVRTPSGSATTTSSASVATTTTTATTTTIVPPKTVPTLPPPTVVIQPGSSTTAAPTTPTTVPGGSDIGITAREVRVAVIADDIAVARGVQAWAQAVNQAGGLAGRSLRVEVRLVTSPAGYAAAVTAACATDFAVVGSSSQFDGQSDALSCGVPELATRIFDVAHRSRPNAYAAIPAVAGLERVGAFKRILATTKGCCRQSVLVPATEPGRAATQQSLRAAVEVGFTTAGTPDVGPGADYAGLVRDLVAQQATFARSGLGAGSTVQLRQAAAANPGSRIVKAWYCDASCDDPSFLAAGGAAVEGQLVDVGLNPLLDQHRIPTMAAYVRAAKRLGTPTTLAGLESYSAGLLFERVARQVVAANGTNGLTRVRLLGAVAGVHDFDAGGILGITDVAGRQPTGCFALLRVHNGHFVRSFPVEPAGLDCGTQNLRTVPTGG